MLIQQKEVIFVIVIGNVFPPSRSPTKEKIKKKERKKEKKKKRKFNLDQSQKGSFKFISYVWNI